VTVGEQTRYRLHLSSGKEILVSEDDGREVLAKLTTPAQGCVDVVALDGNKQHITICLQHVAAIEDAPKSRLLPTTA
jgi:hypothetical protein